MIGKIKAWKFDKVSGFITGDDGVDYYAHFSGLDIESFPVKGSQKVSFDLVESRENLKAVNVKAI